MSARVIMLTLLVALAGALLVGSRLLTRDGAGSRAVLPAPAVPGPAREGARSAAALTTDPGLERSQDTPAEALADRRQVEQAPPAQLRGKVVDRRGTPIAVASLRLARDGVLVKELSELTSDREGRFTWELERAEVRDFAGCEVWAEHDQHLFLSTRVAVEAQAATCRVVMTACPRVEGRLVGNDGVPVLARGVVELEVRSPLPGGEPQRVDLLCDAQGRFHSSGLLPGRLLAIQGSARGWMKSRAEHDLALEPEGIVRVDLELDAGWTLRGIVRDRVTREPVPFATVYAESWGYRERGTHPSTRADGAGRFELRGLALEDRHSFQGSVMNGVATPSESSDARVEFAVLDVTGQADGYAPVPLERQLVALPEQGTAIEDVEVLLEPAGCGFELLVLEPDGATPAQGLVAHVVDAQRNTQFVTTGSDGRLVLEDLPAGSLDLYLWSGTHRAPHQRIYAIVRAQLEPGPVVPTTITSLVADHFIEGRVVDAQDAPLAGVTVQARSRFRCEGLTLSLVSTDALTGTDGSYRIEHLLGGSCEVSVDRDSTGRALATREGRWRIELGPELPSARVPFVAVAAMVVAGRLLGSELAGLRVLLQTVDGETVGQEQAESNGSFSFGGLFPGSFLVVVERDGREVGRAAVEADGSDVLQLTVAD